MSLGLQSSPDLLPAYIIIEKWQFFKTENHGEKAWAKRNFSAAAKELSQGRRFETEQGLALVQISRPAVAAVMVSGLAKSFFEAVLQDILRLKIGSVLDAGKDVTVGLYVDEGPPGLAGHGGCCRHSKAGPGLRKDEGLDT
jgi:hypothetical protein